MVLMQRLSGVFEEHGIVHCDVVRVTSVRMMLASDAEEARWRWMTGVSAHTLTSVEDRRSVVRGE